MGGDVTGWEGVNRVRKGLADEECMQGSRARKQYRKKREYCDERDKEI